jgi:hypothetical protein
MRPDTQKTKNKTIGVYDVSDYPQNRMLKEGIAASEEEVLTCKRLTSSLATK